jgi:hypothetical protein
MKNHKWNLASGAVILLGVLMGLAPRARAQVNVVNMVPASNSGETNRDAEPNLAGDPANPLIFAGSAFTPDPNGTLSGVLYFSQDGGQTWFLTNAFVPASAILGCFTTYCDITLRYAGSSHTLYTGFLSVDGSSLTDLTIGTAANLASLAPTFATLKTSTGVGAEYADQPWVQAATVLEFAGAGNDHTYVDYNDLRLASNTATMDLSLNPVPPPPSGFSPTVVDTTNTCSQDGPSVRPAVHLGGTVYVAFYRWSGTCGTADIVVVRDDNWGTAPSPFQALKDSITLKIGQRAAIGVPLGGGSLGNQRVGSQIAIAVDPSNSQSVFVAWGDGSPYTLHVRHSTDGGQHWGADLRTIASATNPGLAINSHGKIAFLYQALGNSGTGNRWRTHLERSPDSFTTVQDLILADVPDSKGTYPGSNPIGDYDNVIALGKDFYGDFAAFNTANNANFPNAVTYLRYANFTLHQLYADAGQTMPVADSIDPFFFHITEMTADQDYYVRDWTNTPTDHDTGVEPSTNPTYWYSSDVWNRATNTAGTQNASGWFPTDNMQAGTGAKGDNYAFARVERNATGSAGQVTAHFLVSVFGAGSNFQDAGTDPDPLLTFGTADTEQTMSAGYHWHQDSTSSTHACIAVQISTPNDPYIPPTLAGISPAWPTGEAVVIDNNKAQRNLDVTNSMADTNGIDFAVIHNAGTILQNILLRFDSPEAERLRGAQVFVVGGETVEFRPGGTLTLAKMQPGESRWIGLRMKVPAGNPIPVHFLELEEGRGATGFTILARPVALPEAIRDNLNDHQQTFGRLAAAFKADGAEKEAKAAEKLLEIPTISGGDYLTFLKDHVHDMTAVIGHVIEKGGKGDVLEIQKTLTALGGAVTGGNVNQAASQHGILLHEIDSFATMLQKVEGDPSDILQMVRWQLELYESRPKLAHLDQCAGNVVEKSREFLSDWAAKKANAESYPKLLGELSRCFKRTAEALEKGHEELEKLADGLEDSVEHRHSLAAIEKAHRNYLLKLEEVAR